MRRIWSGLRVLLAVAIGFGRLAPTVAADDKSADDRSAARLEFFERHVRPIFAKHCVACHSADTKPAGDLRVDDRQGLLVGGKTGPAVVPGKPGESLLLKRVVKGASKRMPAEGEPLNDEQIAVLTRWIEDGAAWPTLDVKVQRDIAEYQELRAKHWSWQPVRDVSVPDVIDRSWPRDDIDRFILDRLEQAKLAPVGDADKGTLLRRVTYDLTGLPPTTDELDDFLRDTSESAFERVVERLLKSPAFGQQWGRHWLDVARYGESTGPSRNIPYPHAWRYRDYVIQSINDDVPFDQFVREQIAGDLLSAADDSQRNRQLVATGFLALGVKDVNQRFQVRFVMDNVDEQIDVVSRAILGLTVSCARCHDHKFDPVPQHDYYALAGIFTSTEMYAGLRNQMGGSGLAYYVPKRLMLLQGDTAPADPAEVERLTEEARTAKEKWESVRGTPEGLKTTEGGVPYQRTLRAKYDQAEAKLAALTDPVARGHAAHGVRDAEKIGDTELRVRGEAEKLGPVIPRGFLSVVDVPAATPVNSAQSGRLELANWLVDEANPLTARVFVNRVWSRLFGRGLVGTVDNFGTTGDVPTHPELLDYLARATVEDGWSLKRLVRRLVLTRSYHLASSATSDHLAVDPQNKLVWRHAPRRLTAEEIRDSMLAAAGVLHSADPGDSPARKLRMVEMGDTGAEAQGLHKYADDSTLRSVFLPQLRGVTPQALAAFDPVEQSLVSGSREVTTVPAQALFLLNSSFVRQRARELAERLLALPIDDEDERVRSAYRQVFGRSATDSEVARASAFVAQYSATVENDQSVKPADARQAAWLALVQALFATAEFRYVP